MATAWLRDVIRACLRCLRFYTHSYNDADGDDDHDDGDGEPPVGATLLWSKDLEKHSRGDFSFAVIQANEVMEDYSQVEIGSDAIFVGVYDGHGGHQVSRFIRENLFQELMRSVRNDRTITEDTLRTGFLATDTRFLAKVEREFTGNPLIASIGSCCLVGVIWNGTLYISNIGDSRAVIGSLGRCKMIVAEQLTREHNAKREEIRQELTLEYPEDPNIVLFRRGAWRVKGIIQVSRSIGDAYLKNPRFAFDESYPRFHLAQPITRAVITAEPSLRSRVLQPKDKFIIFASDGLWEYLSNQEAAEIVHRNPRNGIAKRLIKVALRAVAKEKNMTYQQVQRIKAGDRRIFHDDISVIVVFLDHGQRVDVAELSYKGSVDSTEPSAFTTLEESV